MGLFFDAHDLQQPRVPLLTPEFVNPLFLKLYCESLQDMGKQAPEVGEAHVTEVFEWYLRQKAARIALQLRLDPAKKDVDTAIQEFCQALADADSDNLAYTVGSSLLDDVVPWQKEWPDTVTGQLLSEGVLTKDMAWLERQYQEVLRFTYQRFADYAIANALLDPVGHDRECLRAALEDGEALGDRLTNVPAGWVDALAVIVPERFDVEALDVLSESSLTARSTLWKEAFIQSLAARNPTAVTERTREHLSRIGRESPRLGVKILDTVLSVAAIPDHPLNARALHRWLKRLPMPNRDSSWSRHTYHALHSEGPIGRLIRWAGRKRGGDGPDDVVELVAITLIWTFTSPNRHLRDHATKAVTQLLSQHLHVLASLVSRFRGVDDPYVIERLAVVAHGAVLCGRDDDRDVFSRIATTIRDVALDPQQNPGLLTRDAVRGVFERCLRIGAIDRTAYEDVLPPYGSSPPDAPRRARELRQLYDPLPPDAGIGDYHSLFGSLFGFGDFGNYIVTPKLRHFYGPMFDIPPEPQAESNRMRDELARCWVFERVLSLGWTPERFGDFDRSTEVPPYTRSSCKAERFGKKYQWIAMRELMARLTDNLTLVGWRGEAVVPSERPWQVLRRDIDPTLPPPPWVHQNEGAVQARSTFADDSEVWWIPMLGAGTESHPLDAKWTSRRIDIPSMAQLVRRTDMSGDSWVALRAYHPWYYDLVGIPDRDRDEPIRDLRVDLYSWLVTPEGQVAFATHVSQQTDGLQWMPRGNQNVNESYLGELPWADSFDDEVAPGGITTDDDPAKAIEAYPAWADYLWEANVMDCSLRRSVGVSSPAPKLFEGGGLEWIPGTRAWRSRDGSVAARCSTHAGHSSLLVRESWLQGVLSRIGYSLVFGLAGDWRLLKRTEHMGFDEIGVSRYLSGVASLHGERWEIGDITAKPE